MDRATSKAEGGITAINGVEIGADGYKLDSGPVVKNFNTIDEAFKAAQNEAGYRPSMLLPCICYKQGVRRFLVTALTWKAILQVVKFDSAEKGKDPEDKRNRPADKGHVKAIKSYIEATINYILPPITLCTESRLNFYVGFSTDDANRIPSMMGYLVVPFGEGFYIQDGQHRCHGVKELLALRDSIGGDSVAVMIALEKDLDQIHQDFADCAAVKPISPSLLAIYNTRDPLSLFVKEITRLTPFFNGRMEKTSATVGKKSQKVFTTNNLRLALVNFMAGSRNYAGNVGETRPQVACHLNEDALSETTAKTLEFFTTFTEGNDLWKQIAETNPDGDSTLVSESRPNYLSLSATGLLVATEVGYDIYQTYGDNVAERKRLVREMAKLDWTRSATLWTGNVVQGTNVVNQSRNHILDACNNIKEELNKKITSGPKLPIKSKSE